MKLIAEVAGQQHTLTLEREAQAPSHFVAIVDDRRYEITTREIATGVRLLLNNERVYLCRVDDTSTHAGNCIEVYVGNESYGVRVIDPKRMRSGQRAGAQAADETAQLVAQMPGKVVRVLVEQGVNVEAGDGLVIVEAMKMQNEMKAPRAGVVVKLNAKAGETVNAGDLLAVIE